MKFKALSKIKQTLMNKIDEQCDVLGQMCGHPFFLEHIKLFSKSFCVIVLLDLIK